LFGALLGGFTGGLELLSEFSFVSLAAAVVAGALFGSIVGVLAVHVAKTRVGAAVLGALAGCISGVAWATVSSSHIATAVVVGVVLGGLVGLLEFPNASGPARAV